MSAARMATAGAGGAQARPCSTRSSHPIRSDGRGRVCIGCRCAPSEAPFSNAQSNHPGGVNVMMADGSCRFIKDTINMTTWMQLGTRAGNEPVDGSAY